MHAQILTGDEIGNLTGRITDAVVAVMADLASNEDEPALHTAAQALVAATRDQLSREPVDAAPMVRAILRHDALGRPLAAHEQDEFGVALSPAIPVVPIAPLPVELDWESDVDIAPASHATNLVIEPAYTTDKGGPVEDPPVGDSPTVVSPVEDTPVSESPTDVTPVSESPTDGSAVVTTAVQADAVDAGAAEVAGPDPSSPVATPSYWPPAPIVSDKLFAQFTADNDDAVPQAQQNDAGDDHAEDSPDASEASSEASSTGPETDQATAEAPAPESDPSQPGHFYAGPLARWNRYHPAAKAGAATAATGRTEP